jgi:hypothetical protein
MDSKSLPQNNLSSLPAHTLVEDLGLFHPSARVTNRMARYIYDLCRVMTIKEVAQHVGLNWKTVKQIDKEFLERDFGQPTTTGCVFWL